MITLELAGVNVGIDNQYDISHRMKGWITDAEPEFTVRVSPEELEQENNGGSMSPEYLEFICVYRHIAERMPDYDAFVFHGAAVEMDGLAYLFTAPSGTGKTTHTWLWRRSFGQRVRFLNGDKPILRKTEQGFQAFGTPWRGKELYGCNAHRPIQGVCMLRRGLTDEIHPARPEELVHFLPRQVYFPRDPRRLDKLLGLVDEFCSSVPIWSMSCTPKASAAVAAYEAMKPAGQ